MSVWPFLVWLGKSGSRGLSAELFGLKETKAQEGMTQVCGVVLVPRQL